MQLTAVRGRLASPHRPLRCEFLRQLYLLLVFTRPSRAPNLATFGKPFYLMPTVKRVITYLVWAFLILASVNVFVPSNPWYPNMDSEAAWMFAVNQAVAQKLVFGKDVAFTYGPYAAIETGLYHPATDGLMLWGSLLIAGGYALLMIHLAKAKRLYWMLVYSLFLKAFVGSLEDRDCLFFSYPLLIALVVYLLTLPEEDNRTLHLARSNRLALAAAIVPLGLLPLIKGSFIVIVSIFAILFFVLFWRLGEKLLAYCTIILPSVSAALFWVIARQPLSALPLFFLNTIQSISGYTDSMAVDNRNSLQIATWVLVATFVLYNAAATKSDPIVSRIVLCLSLALFLFLSFKEGFVRHTGLIAGISALLAALLLNALLTDRMAIATLVLAVVWCGNVVASDLPIAPKLLYRNIVRAYSAVTFENAFAGLRSRWRGADQKEFADSLQKIRKQIPIPKLPGTTDIYSIHQSWLLASENSWSPRPVIQSYAAYTPRLAALNQAHLQSDRAPDNILFRIEPIDGRLPAFEDGLSWPTIITNYSLVQMWNEFALLRKRTDRPKEIPAQSLGTAMHKFGEEVYLPTVTEPLFAEINISPTLLGRVASLLFKTDELRISIQLTDGVRDYRLVANMAKTRFLLSPLVENTSDFVLLTAYGKADVPFKVAKSIRISASGGKSLLWDTAYSMKLSTTPLIGDTDLEKVSLFDRIRTERPAAGPETVESQCDFGIDWINGSPATPPAVVSNRLAVKGWTAISAKDGILADRVFLTLSNAHQVLYLETHIEPRPDVSNLFGHRQMMESGFTSDVDVSKLNGAYTLGLARLYKGKLDSCTQLKVPMRFAR